MHENEEVRQFVHWYEKSYFIKILDEKTFQMVFFPLGNTWISFKNFYCYVLLKF